MKNDTITIDAEKTERGPRCDGPGPRNGPPPSPPGAAGTRRANGTTSSGLTS